MATPYPIPANQVLSTLVELLKAQVPDAFIKVLRNCSARIEEDPDNYGWNNDSGYVFLLEMPPEMLGRLEGNLEQMEKTISEKLHYVSRSTPGHWIGRVHTVPIMSQEGASVAVDAKAVERIWKPNFFRLFISHRTSDKISAAALSEHLSDYGISGFVAHEHIDVSEEWAREIEAALGSMQALLALVSPTFHDSSWTNQEVGFAMARGVPVVPICIDGTLPAGFLGKIQGLKIEAQYVDGLQKEIADLLSKKEEIRQELRSALLEGLIHSPSYSTTSVIYKRLRTQPPLTKDEAERLKEAFKNDQVAGYGSAEKIKTMIRLHFPDFLKPPEPEPNFPLPEDDDIPF